MPQLRIERRERIAICTIDPPDGYMNEDTTAELETATAELERDGAVRAVVITGAGEGVFIRHYDVRELEKLARDLRRRGLKFKAERPVRERPLDQVFERLERMDKPVIAAINGTAMGGGFELALACDLRVAQDGEFALGLPEVRIGLLPGAGGTQKLARLVGMARALELVLRGRTVSPREALALGLVHEVSSGPALARALSLAAELAALPPRAVAHIKRLIRHDAEWPLAEALAVERTLFLDLLVSDDALERMSAMNAGKLDIREVGRK